MSGRLQQQGLKIQHFKIVKTEWSQIKAKTRHDSDLASIHGSQHGQKHGFCHTFVRMIEIWNAFSEFSDTCGSPSKDSSCCRCRMPSMPSMPATQFRFCFFSKCQTTSCTSQTGSHWATTVIRVKVAIAWFNQMHQTSCMRLCLFVCVSPCEIYSGLCVFESIWNIWFQALLCWPTIGKPTLAPAPQQSHCAVCLSKPKTDMVQH